MFSISDIHTVTDFSRNPSGHIDRLKVSGKPEILTMNGKPAVVVQDAQAYERMAQLADYASAVQSIRSALGETGRPLSSFMSAFEEKHGIQR